MSVFRNLVIRNLLDLTIYLSQCADGKTMVQHVQKAKAVYQYIGKRP